ncbi:MAG: sodium:solute symporter, partial [Holophagae bacterium]|nr:sodium:solute symporter [Holophagae bacterium]
MVVLAGVAIYAKRFNKGVADFLVANRCAGRYLLSISEGIANIGAISFVAVFQNYYSSGFCALWWVMMLYPLRLLFSLTGWIIYRYRETRVLTMAQLFEIRYSRRFRVFSGMLAWVSGVINMGIFPAVTARLFIHFCGLPETFSLFGIAGISTYVTIMLAEISIALVFIFLGGMISVIITDFLQGIFCNTVFLILLVFLLMQFEWGTIIEALQMAPENASLINPFKTAKAEGFNMAYFMMYFFVSLYGFRVWQGAQGYNAAAKNPHEAKMAGIISQWREQMQVLLTLFIPICAFTLMHHINFAPQAAEVQLAVDAIGDATIQKQMLVPMALAKMLPIGLMGLFAAVLFASQVSTDDTYFHSWGSIFVQDVILPFRKKPFTPRQHMWVLRASILFVAVFIFIFSLLFRQNDYILMFMFLTGAIFTAGGGVVIVGGLYWKRGTTAAAWTAMLIGSIFAGTGLTLRTLWPDLGPRLLERFPDSTFLAKYAEEFPWNGMQITVSVIACAIAGYVLVSLFSWLVLRRPAFNMNRMLHRGNYAIKGEHGEEAALPPTGLKAILPSKEFTRLDKLLYYALL